MKRIAIVGAGRLASTLARRLTAEGYRITEIVTKGNAGSVSRARSLARKIHARVCTAKDARLDADIIWFCVPDSKIATAASEFAGRNLKGKTALHSSGVLASDVLACLWDGGAVVASLHPLMTFVANSQPELRGVSFAVEGDLPAVRVASRIVRELGGSVVRIHARDKIAYHAFATMICPLLIALMAASERAAKLAGIPARQAKRRMIPIIRQTLANYERLGVAASFSGPIVRGDAGTIARHLEALASNPALKRVYGALAKAALDYLPSRNRKTIASLLD